MKGETISIGTELLMGEITDTNSSYIASQLPSLGIDLYWMSTVGDNRSRIVEVLRRAWGRSDLIITTGGLGPTEDDLTRESIANFLGEKMAVSPDLEHWLREFFRQRGLSMPERNLKQASLIPSARALPNPRGTAPGWWVEREGHLIAALPGPPVEMHFMWEHEVVPRLRERASGDIIVSRTLKTFGRGEASVDELVGPFFASPNPTLGIYAKPDGVHLRLGAKAGSREEAQRLIEPVEAQIRSLLGDSVWGHDDDTIEGIAGMLLRERGLTLATIELGTGGALASIITEAEASDGFYKGGLVCPTVEAALAWGVEEKPFSESGALSPQAAAGLSRAALRLGASLGLGLTAPSGNEEGAQAGVGFLCVSDGVRTRESRVWAPPHRADTRSRLASGALFQLRRFLLETG